MKYRGWNKFKKKFVYDFAISAKNGSPTMIHGNVELNNIINDYYNSKGDNMWGDYGVLDFTDWYAIENIGVDMSTEHQDINNIEIYENDIVGYQNQIYQVKFTNGCFQLRNDKGIVWWHELNNFKSTVPIVVHGNIYENRRTKLHILNKL